MPAEVRCAQKKEEGTVRQLKESKEAAKKSKVKYTVQR
jgi:hypothetical protein